MFGFKVFPSVIPEPDDNTTVKTNDHPIQSFVWDDFTAKPGRKYEYFFHPVKGTPKNLDRSARPIAIEVRTEPLFSTLEHDIFFNRGVASSQAYSRKFDNKQPDKLEPDSKKAEAREWLSRSLDEAMLKFIANAKRNDTLLCCFYEFRYLPVATAIKQAILKPSMTLKFPSPTSSCVRLSRTTSEVAPLSWTPDFLSFRSPQWQRSTALMRRSSAGR